MTDRDGPRDRGRREEIEVGATDLVDRVKDWIADASVRRVIIRKRDGRTLIEVPVTVGAAATGALVLFAPVLAAVGALAGLVANFRVEIVRDDDFSR